MEAQAFSDFLVRSIAQQAAEAHPPVGQGGEGADDAKVQRVSTASEAPGISVNPGAQPAPLEMAGAFSVQIVATLRRQAAATGADRIEG